MRSEVGPQLDNSGDDSVVPERPLDLWPEQLEYARRKRLYDLRDWLERLYEGRPFPVLLSGTDPSVFAIYLYKSGPKEFQQRFRAAMRHLVLSYHPEYNPAVPYLGNLVYVCGQIRIVEAYQTFMDLIYTRAFEGKFATDRDEAAGHDVHSHLLAAAATLRPPHEEGILDYCRRILQGDFAPHYGELAYQILWKAREKYAAAYFGRFVDSLAERPEVESLESIRRQCSAIRDRYGPISLNGHARKLLKKCTKGPATDIRVRRARVKLYGELLSHGIQPDQESRDSSMKGTDTKGRTAEIDDDLTYEYMYDQLADHLKKIYGARNLQRIYGNIPIARAIGVYASTIPSPSELESILTDEKRFYKAELALVRIVEENVQLQSEIAREKSRRSKDLSDPGITRDEIIKKLAAAPG